MAAVTLLGQGWGGFALEGALHGQAELEGCDRSGSTGLSPPASRHSHSMEICLK